MKKHRTARLRISAALFLITLGSHAAIAAQKSKSQRSDVPMTRPEECLAVYDGIGVGTALTQLPDGSILAFSQGKFRKSKDGGRSWSMPWGPKYTNKQTPHLEDGSIVVFKDKTLGYVGRVVSAMPDMGPKPLEGTPEKKKYDEIRDNYKKARDVYMMLWRSKDEGRTWEGSTRISPQRDMADPYNQGCLHNALIRAASGRLLVPSYGNSRVHVYYSDDEGVSWKQSAGVRSFVDHETKRIEIKGSEPSIVEVEPGRMLMFLRNDANRIFQSWSSDNGQNWTEGKGTQLAASRSPAALAKIPGTNDLMVVWNQASVKELRNDHWRSRLSTAISRDQGKTWTNFQNIESSIEGVHIEPEPIHPEWLLNDLNPRQDNLPGYPDYVRNPEKRKKGRLYGSYTYPCILFHGQTVIIGHADLHWKLPGESGANPQWKGDEEPTCVGRLRVVPVSWLYGGKMPKGSGPG